MNALNVQTLALLLVIVLPLLATLARDLGALLLQDLPADKRAQVEHLIDVTVRGVEQANRGVPGPAKKQVAKDLLTLLLGQLHLSASPELLDVLIEASVQALNLETGSQPKSLGAGIGFAPPVVPATAPAATSAATSA